MPVVKEARIRHKIIDQLLRSPRKRTVVEIAAEVSDRIFRPVSKETIYLDLKHLEAEYGAILVREKGKVYYEDSSFSIENLPLTDEDTELLNVASMIFRTFKKSSILHKFESTIDKILTGTSLGVIFGRDELNYIQFDIASGDAGYEWIEPLMKAIIDKSPVEITYHKYGSTPEKKLISPYVLKEFRNHWYLIGFDQLKSKLTKVYALDRILEINASKEEYHTDEDFNAEAYFKYSFGVYHRHNEQPEIIELEFSGNLAAHIFKHPLSSTQKSKWSNDGTVLYVQIELYVGPEIVSELLRYGSSVKVVAPSKLKEMLLESLNNTLQLY
jgi:predicted DNA-binding transcriptional regulator YafY